jgi:hypothetical protein
MNSGVLRDAKLNPDSLVGSMLRSRNSGAASEPVAQTGQDRVAVIIGS